MCVVKFSGMTAFFDLFVGRFVNQGEVDVVRKENEALRSYRTKFEVGG